LAAASPLRTLLVFLPALGLVSGLVASLAGAFELVHMDMDQLNPSVLIVLCIEIVTSLRRGDVGLDMIAALAESTGRCHCRRCNRWLARGPYRPGG
jgi:hypothetical protein